jgi:uncharacterized protein (DUF1697 family)
MAGTKHVALLRGINVGGNNLVPMKRLAEVLTASGCADVQTYIQSGNIVFSRGRHPEARLSGLISKVIADEFDVQVPVVLRTANDLRSVVRTNPYLKSGADPAFLHVAFLADEPTHTAAAALDPMRSVPDAFELRGRDIYLHLPNGVARTKLTNAYFDTKLGTTSTLRNWRTVLKLLEMAGG